MLGFDESLFLAPLSAGATATNSIFVGMSDWSITVNSAITGATSGFVVQVNNSHPNSYGGQITPMSSGALGVQNFTQNSTFQNEWVNYTTLTNQAVVFNAPFRFVRIVNSSSAFLASRVFYLSKAYPLQNR